jgi:Flp pilus assembly protein TadD
MIRAQGTVQEVCIRSMCIVAATVSLFACSQAAQPPTMSNGASLETPQRDMAVVVIRASRAAAQPTG